ncbi:hypothetical protein [Streptomyces sp. XY006]|nr:hypothetical protein [Streptomyces sp. XY006]
MSEQKPDLTPQPNQILAEPATPQRCAEDYAQAADIRDRMDQQDRQHR